MEDTNEEVKKIFCMFESFSKVNYNRLMKHVIGGNPHKSLIGEWVRWWIEDSKYADKGLAVRDEADHLLSIDRRADLCFLLKRKGNYDVIGVAEIENSPRKYADKIATLGGYENEKDSQSSKLTFPHIKFLLLSMTQSTHRYANGKLRLSGRSRKNVEETINRIKEISKKSKKYWIYFVLKREKPYQYTNTSLEEMMPQLTPDFYIIKNGKVLRKHASA